MVAARRAGRHDRSADRAAASPAYGHRPGRRDRLGRLAHHVHGAVQPGRGRAHLLHRVCSCHRSRRCARSACVRRTGPCDGARRTVRRWRAHLVFLIGVAGAAVLSWRTPAWFQIVVAAVALGGGVLIATARPRRLGTSAARRRQRGGGSDGGGPDGPARRRPRPPRRRWWPTAAGRSTRRFRSAARSPIRPPEYRRVASTAVWSFHR